MRCVLVILASLLLPSQSLADIYFVQPDGGGDYPTIQAAIDAAADGDIIELADGVFTGDGNRDITYREKELTVRSRSNDPYSCILDCEGTISDMHVGFVISQVGPDASLQGIMIRNGFAPWWGGAITVSYASPLIRDCVFYENNAEMGGAIYCDTDAEPRLVSCTFWSNHAYSWAGGICI